MGTSWTSYRRCRRVEKQLSGDDKERFAPYMDSFDSLRKIEQKKAALTDRIQHAPERTDRYIHPSARIESPFEIASAALVAGLTNVVTLRPDTLGVKYSELGLSPPACPRPPTGKQGVQWLDRPPGPYGN